MITAIPEKSRKKERMFALFLDFLLVMFNIFKEYQMLIEPLLLTRKILKEKIEHDYEIKGFIYFQKIL